MVLVLRRRISCCAARSGYKHLAILHESTIDVTSVTGHINTNTMCQKVRYGSMGAVLRDRFSTAPIPSMSEQYWLSHRARRPRIDVYSSDGRWLVGHGITMLESSVRIRSLDW